MVLSLGGKEEKKSGRGEKKLLFILYNVGTEKHGKGGGLGGTAFDWAKLGISKHESISSLFRSPLLIALQLHLHLQSMPTLLLIPL